MFRIVIVLIGVVWASLLLISWGSTAETPYAPAAPPALERGHS